MKKLGLLILVMLGFTQVSSTTEDYSKMSADELDKALIGAVRNGSSEEVQELVRAGANVNHTDRYGGTPLLLAMQYRLFDTQAQKICWKKNRLEIIQTLLKAKVNVNQPDKSGDIALVTAAKIGWVEVVKELINAGADVNAANEDGETALSVALDPVLSVSVDLVRELLSAPGIDISAQLSSIQKWYEDYLKKSDSDKRYLEQFSGHRIMLKIFELFKPYMAAQDYSKMSANELYEAFIRAVKRGASDQVQELIQAGADVINTPIPYEWTSGDCDWKIESTALIYAVRHNDAHMVTVLAKADKRHNEALDEAIREGRPDVVEALIHGGADINYADKKKNTPLIKAIQHARATAEFYLQAQAQKKSRWQQRRKIIHTLLKAGANVNHVNKYGRTALMEAVIEHDLHTVQSLLQSPESHKGSFFGFGTKPINYADRDGNTALILAIKNIRCAHIDDYEYDICVSSQNIINALLQTPGINRHHVNKKGDTAITLFKKIEEEGRYWKRY